MRTVASSDDIRQCIWDTANKEKRYYMMSYFMIMEFLCYEYDAECADSLDASDYSGFIKDLESGKWKHM